MTNTLFANTFAITANRQMNVRSYWKIGSLWLGVLGAMVLAASMPIGLDVGTGIGLSALTFAVLGAYIGYNKDTHPDVGVHVTRVFGLVAALAVLAAATGYASLSALESASMAALAGAALYVGFNPA